MTTLLADPTRLMLPASKRLDELMRSAYATIDEAVRLYKVTSLWALFSGGHDSLTVTHLLSGHHLFRGVIHIDTGTGLPETRAFVDAVCQRFGWQLIVKKPAITYEMLLVRYGFPGPAMHREMYKCLKERPLRQAVIAARKIDGSKRPVIGKVGGMRSQESARRMGNTEPHNKDREGVWISAIHNWTALDCADYMRAFALPRSEVKDKMHLSGECFCGSFARSDELKELRFWYPKHAEWIEARQELLRTALRLGITPIPAKYCDWGHGSGQSQDQLELFPMCYYCRGALPEPSRD